ncbi:MAG: hypothetical protein J6B80_02605 [Clostridia bacterium]|nr:hypothetical protein [Clostridia bacterium]
MSADYLGINGLYSNILSVLALAELGLGNVTQFFLYKPVAENDYAKVTSLFKYFQKLYVGIAGAVLVIGIAVIPFLKHIVNSDLKQNELIIYYILFLLNSVITYFSAPHIALLAANQDNRLHKIITLVTNFVLQFAHIVVLCVWHNYVLYVCAILLGTVCNVILLNIICLKRYPYIRSKGESVNIDKRGILANVKSTFFYKVGAVIVNNTTNILISVLISTAMVGIYSNYFMVVSGVQGFITIITTSLISGIGNLSAQGNRERMYSVFNTLLLFYNYIATVGGIGFFLVFNDFISFWLGEGYTFESNAVFAIAFAFYLTNAISPIWMYREANGLFNKVKYLMLTVAVCNIVFAVVLEKFFGIFGVLLAPSLARLVTQVWYEPQILFKSVFGISQKKYWRSAIRYFVLTVISFLLCYFATMYLSTGIDFMVLKAIIIVLICTFVYAFLNIGTPQFKEIKNLLSLINKRRKA